MTEPSGLTLALVTAFPPGQRSLNEYGLHLARSFAARPDVARVIVLADRLSGPVRELELGPKVRVRRCWRFNSAGAGLSIAAALRAERADAVLFNLQTATFGDWEVPAALGLFAPALARLTGTPTGVLAHNLVDGIDLDATQLKGQWLRQRLVQVGGAITTRALLWSGSLAVTLEGYRSLLAARYPGASVAVVPHGTFDTAGTTPLPSAARPLRIVTMGKFGTYKRLETLLRAFEILRADGRFEGLELVIGGQDHPGTPGYMARIARQAAGTPGLRFAGYLPEEAIPAFFGSARASVFDYDATTGSSGVLHQTASYGAVPVFPRIGDFVDVCRDEGLGGLNYDSGDADGMARAIAEVLVDPDRADRIANANRAASLDMPFSEVTSRHLALLRERMRDRAPRRDRGRALSAG